MYIALGIVFFFVILFVLYLFDMFSSENDAKKNIVYPPWINSCPDYWKHTKNDEGIMICERDSENPTGDYNCDSYNLGEPDKFSLLNLSNDDLKDMAHSCNLPWEGINDP